jgi:hypothetical protein
MLFAICIHVPTLNTLYLLTYLLRWQIYASYKVSDHLFLPLWFAIESPENIITQHALLYCFSFVIGIKHCVLDERGFRDGCLLLYFQEIQWQIIMEENFQQKIKTSTQRITSLTNGVDIVHRCLKVVGGMIIVSVQTWMACTMHLFVNSQYSILFEPSLLYLSRSNNSLSSDTK